MSGFLSQKRHPAYWVSKTLSQAEQRYSNLEREALAIFVEVKRLSLFVRKLQLETDHLRSKQGTPKNHVSENHKVDSSAFGLWL